MAIATPNVRLIAHTTIPYEFIEGETLPNGFTEMNSVDATDDFMERGEGTTDADHLAEFAGRSCYESWSKPNPKTADNADYLANIIRQAHFSVLEHASATFYLTGVSRALLAELTRHRHLSFSVVSQRFVDSSNAAVVVPPALRGDEAAEKALNDWQATVGAVYESMVADLQAKGHKRKQAREAARCLMPNMTETKIVVTGNMAAWRYVIARRIDPSADAEIREVAGMILAELKKLAPNSFGDFE